MSSSKQLSFTVNYIYFLFHVKFYTKYLSYLLFRGSPVVKVCSLCSHKCAALRPNPTKPYPLFYSGFLSVFPKSKKIHTEGGC